MVMRRIGVILAGLAMWVAALPALGGIRPGDSGLQSTESDDTAGESTPGRQVAFGAAIGPYGWSVSNAADVYTAGVDGSNSRRLRLSQTMRRRRRALTRFRCPRPRQFDLLGQCSDRRGLWHDRVGEHVARARPADLDRARRRLGAPRDQPAKQQPPARPSARTSAGCFRSERSDLAGWLAGTVRRAR